MPVLNKKNDNAVNEFNQYVKPVSLWADAWKRLRKNKMAVIGMWIVGIYLFVTFGAGLLPFYSYTDQELLHSNLPPSFKQAGVVAIEKLEKRRVELSTAIEQTGRQDLKGDLERVEEEIAHIRRDMGRDPEIGRASCRERV